MTVVTTLTRLKLSATPLTVTLRDGFAATTTNVSLAGASVTKKTTVAMVQTKTITISVCCLFA